MPNQKNTNRLRMWAELMGLNVTDIANLLGVTRRTVRDLMTGKTKDIMLSTATKIEKLTLLKPEDYLGIK
jgi:plasmid maintenance system antidote protein VapI